MKKTLKKIYYNVPMKKQLFSLLKHFYAPPEHIYKHLNFKGDFRVFTDEQHSFLLRHYGFILENEIFWDGLGGCYEKLSMELWITLSSQSEVVFDVGANTGVYSLVTKSLNRKAKVYAFEPVHRVFEKLLENNALNNYDIICIGEAVSDVTGTATIYDTPTEHTYAVTVGKNLNDPGVKVIPTSIKTVRLDEFMESSGIERLDLMKIDVETHEAEVLAGLGKYLKLYKPAILIEILNDEVGKDVEKVLAPHGYLYFNIDDEKGLLRQTDKITKSDNWNYILCSPEVAAKLNLVKS